MLTMPRKTSTKRTQTLKVFDIKQEVGLLEKISYERKTEIK